MNIRMNGKDKQFPEGTTLGQALEGELHRPGAAVSILISTDLTRQKTDEYQLVFDRGSFNIRLDDSEHAGIWRSISDSLVDNNVRWNTSKVLALGSFPTEIEVDKGLHMRKRYDVFFSLGGFDSSTTYLMFSKHNHRGRYGAGGGRVGKITKGRHMLDEIREADTVREIRPIIKETSSSNSIITEDMDMVLEDGMAVESHITINLEENSPMAAEHLLVSLRDGTLPINQKAESFISCSENIIEHLIPGEIDVRQEFNVTVRTSGKGTGRIFIFKKRRQLSEHHTLVGKVVQGMNLLNLAEKGQHLTVKTVPDRALAVGMTQAEGMEFLASRGIEQERTGEIDDDAIIVEQEPEMTIEALSEGKVVTKAVKADRIFALHMDRENALRTVRYLERVTGLDHKPVGILKVHFTYPGLPMVTFDGDTEGGKSIYPENEFKSSERAQIGITNQVRPHAGLIGIRLEGSDEYGPTGEEPYGTNIVGTFVDDLERLMEGLEEGQNVYVKEEEIDG